MKQSEHKAKVVDEKESLLKEQAVTNADIATDCLLNAALTIKNLNNSKTDAPTVLKRLFKSANQLNNGNIKEIEQMLMTQAKTLDYLFYDSLNKLIGCNLINQIESFTNIALRAQNQSKKTLMALASLKNPQNTTFIKQQNNAINQQINNQQPELQTKKSKKVANELLEVKSEQRLDIGATAAPVTNDSTMETVAICRSEDG